MPKVRNAAAQLAFLIRSVLNRTLEITHGGMLGGLYGLQCGTIAGRSGIVYALADSAFLSGAAVIVRQLLPLCVESRGPEEIGTRFFFGKLAGAFSNGWIDRDVVVYALNGESYLIRHVRFGGATYQYCV